MSMQSEEINELATALAKAQGAMANAVMNRTNPHFRSKYADLSSVLDSIRTPLSANGLAIVQTMKICDVGMTLRTTLMHAGSGQFIATEYPLPATQKQHEMGSALTYARRYSIAALVCNSAEEDDDGNMAMTAKSANGASNGAHISQQQTDTLLQLIEEVGVNSVKFCKTFDVAGVAMLPASKYDEAVLRLNEYGKTQGSPQ